MASDWITTTEAAELSGYHPEHLRRLIREGTIKSRKFGIVWQVDKISLTAFMNEAEKLRKLYTYFSLCPCLIPNYFHPVLIQPF